VPPLTRAARLVIAANTISALGHGFTLPFLLIYLNEVRGVSLPVVGLTLSAMGGAGLAVGPYFGTLVDRFGARRMLLAALAVATTGDLLLATVHATWQAFLATAVMGFAGAGLWSALTALLAGVTTGEQRQRAFALEFQLLNAGIGVGGIAGGLIADTSRPATFVALYLLDAASFVGCGLVIAPLRGVGGPHEVPTEPGTPTGYRDVLADRAFVRYAGLTLLAASAGYIQIESGFPAYARGVAEVSTRVVGLAFATNTAVIVLAQLLVLRLLHGRRRSRALAAVGLVWAFSWLVFAAAGLVPGSLAAAILVAGSAGVFALGETMWQPTGSALVNDLAPAHLRGRYNALASLTWQAAALVGPPVAGALLGAGWSLAWVALVVGAMLAYAAGAWRLGRLLTPAQEGLAPQPAPPPAVGDLPGAVSGAGSSPPGTDRAPDRGG